MAIADGQILANAINLAQRRESRKNFGTRIQEIALTGVKAVLQITDEDVVILVKRVVDPDHIVWPGEFGGWIPIEAAGVESVANREIIGLRKTVQQLQYRRIATDSAEIVGKDIVCGHTVGGERRAIAHRHASLQIAARID